MSLPNKSEFRQIAHDYPAINPADCAQRTLNLGVRELRAFVLDDPRPLVARAANLRQVTSCLQEANIDFFAVKGFNDLGSTLSVDLEDRERVIAALRRLPTSANMERITPRPAVARGPLTTDSRTAATELQDARVVRLWWNFAPAVGNYLLGKKFAVDVEFWAKDQWREGLHGQADFTPEEISARYLSPRPNRLGRLLDLRRATFTEGDSALLGRFETLPESSGITTRMLEETGLKLIDEVVNPIDVVYTWVDGDDPAWQRRRAAHSTTPVHTESASSARFLSRDELRYSLRSLYAYTPWVRNVFIVTDDQVPPWLNENHPGITLVSHRDIFGDATALPVFNSHAIESALHHIPGLSEHFLYFNDDMFIGNPLTPEAFFTPGGIMKIFPSQSRVQFGPHSPTDTPVDSATKNVRSEIFKEFGLTITQVMEHAPYSARRSILEEMEGLFSEAFQRTRVSKFRAPTDVNILSNFIQHYALASGRAVPSSLSFAYIGLAVPDLQARLARLLKERNRSAFCLNDTFSSPEELDSQREIVGDFLTEYFPVPGPWELN